MRTESRAGCGGIGLYGVAFVEQTLFIYYFEKVPQGLYIAVIIGNIGIVHIHPVTYKFGK